MGAEVHHRGTEAQRRSIWKAGRQEEERGREGTGWRSPTFSLTHSPTYLFSCLPEFPIHPPSVVQRPGCGFPRHDASRDDN